MRLHRSCNLDSPHVTPYDRLIVRHSSHETPAYIHRLHIFSGKKAISCPMRSTFVNPTACTDCGNGTCSECSGERTCYGRQRRGGQQCGCGNPEPGDRSPLEFNDQCVRLLSASAS